jgi:hypothetical protein
MPGFVFLRLAEEVNILEILKISGVLRFIHRDIDYRVLDKSDKAFGHTSGIRPRWYFGKLGTVLCTESE